MSDIVSWYIIGLTTINLIGIIWLIIWTARIKVDVQEGEKMSHGWDGIVELNNSMPRWWLHMFWITIVFGIAYLALYPGMGNFPGFFGWTSSGEWQAEMDDAEKEYGPKLAALAEGSITDIAGNDAARQTGGRLFLTYCAVCHGSTGHGNVGYPNLTDDAWLWGGEPETIQATITSGRAGSMPPMLATLGGDDVTREQGLKEVTAYVMSLSGREVDADLAAKGQGRFAVCGGCHGMDGTGNPALGAPNLADDNWLHSRNSDKSVEANIRSVVSHGINNDGKLVMPAFGEFLGEARVKILAGYVYGLNKE